MPALVASLAAWRATHAQLDLRLVRGNHDRHAGDPPADLRIACEDAPVRLGPFALHHHPPEAPGESYWLAGHVHPVALLSGTGRQRLRLPCFAVGAHGMILPAYGSFTGGHPVSDDPHWRIWVVAEDEVLAVPRARGVRSSD